MAQHDYVIDNQTAPNFRSDLNSALSAIVSTNSGASAPSTTYANMLWYDTTNDILKMRNEANSAWINIGTLNQSTGQFEVANLTTLTQADWEAGTVTTEAIVSPVKVKAAIASLSIPHIASATTTSGTSHTLTGIPAGVNQVDIFFKGVSHNDNTVNGDLLVQLGTSGGIVTSGYSSASTTYAVTRSSAAGFIFLNVGASSFMHGVSRLRRIADGTESWILTGEGKIAGTAGIIDTWSDAITLAGALTQIRLTTSGGAPVFDAGTFSIRCYY